MQRCVVLQHMADSTSKLASMPIGMTRSETTQSPVVSVVLPTYNERDNIVDLIVAIGRELEPLAIRYEVLVVDDSSPDDTARGGV